MRKMIIRVILSIISLVTITALIKGSLIVGIIGSFCVALISLFLDEEINTTTN